MYRRSPTLTSILTAALAPPARRVTVAALLLAAALAFRPSGTGEASLFCSRPWAPPVPFGGFTDQGDMDRAESDVDRYARDMASYLDCLSDERFDARQEYDRVIDDWNAAVRAFNNR